MHLRIFQRHILPASFSLDRVRFHSLLLGSKPPTAKKYTLPHDRESRDKMLRSDWSRAIFNEMLIYVLRSDWLLSVPSPLLLSIHHHYKEITCTKLMWADIRPFSIVYAFQMSTMYLSALLYREPRPVSILSDPVLSGQLLKS